MDKDSCKVLSTMIQTSGFNPWFNGLMDKDGDAAVRAINGSIGFNPWFNGLMDKDRSFCFSANPG